MKQRNDEFISPKSQLFLILILVILFHFLISSGSLFAKLFPSEEIVYLTITLVVIIVFGGLFYFEKKSLIQVKPFKIIYFQKHSVKQKAFVQLFLATIIPITLIGIIARIYVINLVPENLSVADMLPLIQKSGEALLQGQNPYQVYYFPYAMPLTFMPGLWLPFLPTIIFGFDLRYTGIFIWILISIILIFYTVKVSNRNLSPTTLLYSGINICLLQCSPELISFHTFGHTFALWLWLILLCIGLLEDKPILTAIALGMAVCSRQTAVIFIPLIFAFWIHRYNWIFAIRHLLLSGLVFLCFSIPFMVQDPYQFLIAPILHYQHLANYDLSLENSRFIINTIGFAYLIQTQLGTKVLSVLNGLVVLGIAISSFFMTISRRQMIIFMAAILTSFLFFTPIPWTYTYYPILLILSFVFLT